MRVHIIVAGLILAIIGKASATVVDKGTDAQKSCELLVKNSLRNQDEARSAGACEGMIETTMLFSPNLPADIRACPPAQGSILQSAKVFLRYLDNNRYRSIQRCLALPWGRVVHRDWTKKARAEKIKTIESVFVDSDASLTIR